MPDSLEDKEVTVVMEFQDNTPEHSEDFNFKCIGLDTEKPFLQCGKQVFIGEWNEPVGTKVLLAEKDVADIPSDPLFSPATKKQYEVYATSNNILRLRNITLKPKIQRN